MRPNPERRFRRWGWCLLGDLVHRATSVSRCSFCCCSCRVARSLTKTVRLFRGGEDESPRNATTHWRATVVGAQGRSSASSGARFVGKSSKFANLHTTPLLSTAAARGEREPRCSKDFTCIGLGGRGASVRAMDAKRAREGQTPGRTPGESQRCTHTFVLLYTRNYPSTHAIIRASHTDL